MPLARSAQSEAANATLRAIANERLRMIISEVRGPRVLHVGCGGNRLPATPSEDQHSLHIQMCAHVAEAEILGLDLNEAAVSHFNARGYRVVRADAEQLPYRGEFDTVVAGELIEHLANPGLFLEGCSRALRPKGRLILSTPNAFGLMFSLMYAKNFDRAFNREHSMWFCPQTLCQILSRHGFSRVDFHFADDLRPEIVSSTFYRSFARAWRVVRPVFPRRYRNTIVAVCELT